MKYRLFIISILLTIVGKIFADNVSVADINLAAGEEKQIAISLTNETNKYVAFQFDLSLPTGVSVTKEGNEFVASLNGDRVNDHTLTVGALGNNVYRFLSYSGNNSEFIGSSGALVYVKLKATDNLPFGNHTAKVINQKFTIKSGSKFTLEDASFIISNPEPAPAITVTAKDASRDYGKANPTFEYVVSGGTLQGEPVLTCTATPQSAVGQYDIVISKGSVTNENVTFVNGTLSVTKASLTIIADDKQMIQGEPLPEFTASYLGFKNNETETVLTKKPEFLCEATSNSDVGTYDIAPVNASATNYNLSYTKGTLTISPNPLPGADKMVVDDVSIEAGSLSNVAFTLINPEHRYVSFQFDFVLPDGVTIAKDSNGDFMVSLDNSRTNKHILTVGNIGSNTYRILAYSETNAEFAGNDGAIVDMALEANASMASGSYTATIVNQKFTVANGTKYAFEDTSFGITITAPVSPAITIKAKNVNRIYGDANPIFEYEVTGGTLQGYPVLTCSAVSTSSVGEYDIVVSKGSVTNENVIFINGTLTVTKASLTIKADDKEMTQNSDLPEFTSSYFGFKNDETESVLTKKPLYQCNATSGSDVGKYTITPYGAEAANYDISYQTGTLTIISANIIVRVKDCSRLYGDENPKFEYTVEGGTLNAEPRITCNAYSWSDVGDYEIKISRGSYKDANVTFINGTLSVLPTPLTISVSDYTLKRGKPIPEFEIIYSGFKNGQNVSSLSKKAVVTCDATEESVEGEYEIVVSGAEAINYEMLYQNGTLTIIPPISIILSNTVAGQVESHINTCGYLKGEIDELTIMGQLNGTDIKYIREMILDGVLTTLNIRDSRIVKGGEAYYNLFGLSYTTDNDIIGSSMFADLQSLMFLQLPNSVKKIETGAISNCNNIKVINMPESCEEIADYLAISNCKRLEVINIFDRLHTIGTMNFSSCPSLREINVSDNNNWYCSKDGVLFSKNKKSLLKYPMGKSCDLYSIPEGTEQIGESAFENAILQVVLIPNSIKRIEEQAFSWCKNLTVVWSDIVNIDQVAFGTDYFGKVNAFEYIPSNCTWHVVEGTSDQYRGNPWWVDSWIIIDDGPSAIIPLQNERTNNGAWYNLQGVRLEGRPLKHGIYLNNGRKVLVK